MKGVNDGGYVFNFDKTTPAYSLKQGESITLRGLVGEADGYVNGDCGIAPNYIPSVVSAKQLLMSFDKTYFYEDLASAPSGITITEADAVKIVEAGGKCSVRYKLDIEIIR